MDEEILYRSLRGTTDPAEEASVRAWRDGSAGNERAYRELAEILDVASRSERPIETDPPSAFKLIHAAELASTESAADAEASRRRRPWNRRWIPAAAAAAAVLVLGIGLVQLQERAASGGFDADEFVTGVAETATLTLRDGTLVRLAPQSRLRLIGGTNRREVSLRGRAYFAVAPDPERPFRIETEAGRVEVLGTRFDLEAADDDLRLVVVEGRVALSARGNRTEVPAGEMRAVVDGTTLPAVKVPDARSAVSWVGNFLAFQQTPLRDAANEIERHYDVRIEITDSALARQTITSWFADEELEQVMKIFCMVAEARCTTGEDGVITVAPNRGR